MLIHIESPSAERDFFVSISYDGICIGDKDVLSAQFYHS